MKNYVDVKKIGAEKFHDQRSGLLVCRRVVFIDRSTPKRYIAYELGRSYAGKDGKYIQLVFIGEIGIPFSVLEPYTESGWNRYGELLGCTVELRKEM